MRLIDADALMNQYERIDWHSVSKSGGLMRGATSEDNPVIHYYDGEKVIEDAPTIEAEPIRHGQWVNKEVDEIRCHVYGNCSVCHERKRIDNYCPNCGAKMDKEG